jgi:acetyl esterase/lipase
MRPTLPGLLAALLPALGAAANAEAFPIFRGRAPGEHGDSEHEHVTNSTDGRLIANVTVPTLSVEWPPAEPGAPPPPVVLVFPGGGFEHLYIDKEGADVVPWLKRLGLGAAVLKYRVPLLLPRPNLPGLRPGLDAAAEIWRPLMDAQRAVGLVRARCAAGVWRCNASAVGVLGFSAGGGLAGALSTHWRERLYPPTDAADTESARPDFSMVTKHHPRPCFQILPQHCPRCVNSVVSCRLLLCAQMIYPAPLTVDMQTTSALPPLLPGFEIDTQTPPAFLAQATDDGFGVDNSLAWWAAARRVVGAAPAELNIFASGGHGWGCCADPSEAVCSWTARAERWLRDQGVLAQ